MESLKLKLHRLSNTEKPTSDQSFARYVQWEARISRDILSRMNEVALGVDSEDDEDSKAN